MTRFPSAPAAVVVAAASVVGYISNLTAVVVFCTLAVGLWYYFSVRKKHHRPVNQKTLRMRTLSLEQMIQHQFQDLLNDARKDLQEFQDANHIDIWSKPAYVTDVWHVLCSDLGAAVRRCGGLANISIKVQLLSLDLDGDGVISEEESDSMAKKLTENSNDLILNMGVIGSLFLSILHSDMFEDTKISDDAVRVFGLRGAHALGSFTDLCNVMATVLSLTVVWMSVDLYLSLNFWTPTSAVRLWFLSNFSTTPLTAPCIAVVVLTWVAALLRALVSASTGVGLTTLLFMAIVCAGMGWHMTYHYARSISRLHRDLQDRGNKALSRARLCQREKEADEEEREQEQIEREEEALRRFLLDIKVDPPEESKVEVRARPSHLLAKSHLTMSLLRAAKVYPEVLNSSLKDAGIEKSGDRLAIIVALSGEHAS